MPLQRYVTFARGNSRASGSVSADQIGFTDLKKAKHRERLKIQNLEQKERWEAKLEQREEEHRELLPRRLLTPDWGRQTAPPRCTHYTHTHTPKLSIRCCLRTHRQTHHTDVQAQIKTAHTSIICWAHTSTYTVMKRQKHSKNRTMCIHCTASPTNTMQKDTSW